MAGYDYSSGMSNNAVNAYIDGLVPASKIGRGIPAALVEKFCRPAEWHHSSKNYNAVNFYHPRDVLAIFGKLAPEEVEGDELPSPNPAAVAALAAYKTAQEAVYINCTVEWIEWSGSLNRPVANERKEEGATVSVKKSSATITLASGRVFIKRLSTRGFKFKGDVK